MNTSAAAAVQASQRGNEPSMEEILASIRKIIADDQKVLGAAPDAASIVAPAPAVNDDAEDDVLDLASLAPPPAPVAVVPPPAPAPAPQVEAVAVAPAPPPAYVAPLPPQGEPARLSAPAAAPDQLLSNHSAGATSAAFQSLANAVFTQNARTMDDLVQEMLRPMLANWLDENLPALVERLVKAEIERVARGGR